MATPVVLPANPSALSEDEREKLRGAIERSLAYERDFPSLDGVEPYHEWVAANCYFEDPACAVGTELCADCIACIEECNYLIEEALSYARLAVYDAAVGQIDMAKFTADTAAQFADSAAETASYILNQDLAAAYAIRVAAANAAAAIAAAAVVDLAFAAANNPAAA